MIDHDAIKLDRLIRKRRRELGLVPNRWRVIFNRLANDWAIFGSLFL